MTLEKQISDYKLYAEQEPRPTPEMARCESIATRSHLHNWQIKPHQHNGLFQILSEMGAGQILMMSRRRIHGFRFEPCVQSAATLFRD